LKIYQLICTQSKLRLIFGIAPMLNNVLVHCKKIGEI
jgi:hypothetical protein